jgi:LmbE family N-acetylglucosaminyl deacetylase
MIRQASQCALVLAPHPDDETFGCGGTIRTITSEGGRVDVAFLTSGEMGFAPGAATSTDQRLRLAETRRLEAQRACEILGVERVNFLEGEDTRLQSQPSLAGRIRQVLDLCQYRTVFCPWPGDAHGDHAAVCGLLKRALVSYPRELDVWFYEIWTPMDLPNLLLPIDSILQSKLAAIAAYESQLAIFDYRNAFEGLARFRSLLCPPARHAEAFYLCSVEELHSPRALPWSWHTTPLVPHGVLA